MRTFKSLSTTAFATVALAGGTAAGGTAAAGAQVPFAGAAQARQYEGTVTSVDRGARTFRLRDAERGAITVRVTGRTRFEGLSGFSALRAGLRRIETTVRRSNGRWVASVVERSGGGGEHGGDDDHRGRGRGNDD